MFLCSDTAQELMPRLLTFLSHFALALAQCTQAIGIRSVGESISDSCRLVKRCEYSLLYNLGNFESPWLYERSTYAIGTGGSSKELRARDVGNVSCIWGNVSAGVFRAMCL
jgi:hypothetical protein